MHRGRECQVWVVAYQWITTARTNIKGIYRHTAVLPTSNGRCPIAAKYTIHRLSGFVR